MVKAIKVATVLAMLVLLAELAVWVALTRAQESIKSVTLKRYATVHAEDTGLIGMIYQYPVTGQCWLSTSEGIGEITCP